MEVVEFITSNTALVATTLLHAMLYVHVTVATLHDAYFANRSAFPGT